MRNIDNSDKNVTIINTSIFIVGCILAEQPMYYIQILGVFIVLSSSGVYLYLLIKYLFFKNKRNEVSVFVLALIVLLGALISASHVALMFVFTDNDLKNSFRSAVADFAGVNDVEEQVTAVEMENRVLRSRLAESEERASKDKEDLLLELQNANRALDDIEKSIPSYSDVDIIESWRNAVVSIECLGNDGGLHTGSGTLFRDGGEYFIISNEHVISDASYCIFTSEDMNYWHTIYSEDMYVSSDGYDISYLYPSESNRDYEIYAKNLDDVCINVSQRGEDVVIIGYPSMGGDYYATATSGTVSSYEDWYYVVDAKIDQGNSGGAAIMATENCYLGIPTMTRIGLAESWGRVLSVDVIFEWE